MPGEKSFKRQVHSIQSRNLCHVDSHNIKQGHDLLVQEAAEVEERAQDDFEARVYDTPVCKCDCKHSYFSFFGV